MIPIVASGIDSLYLSIKATLCSETMDFYREIKEGIEEKEQRVPIGSFVLRLQKHGARMYEFLFKSDELDIKLSESLYLPNIIIELRSSFLQQYGHKEAVEKAKEILASGILDKSYYRGEDTYDINVSRVDLFCDIQEINLNLDLCFNVLTKAKKKIPFYEGDRLTGFLIGKFPFGFRMYDKTKEITVNKKKDWIKEVWKKSPDYNKNNQVIRIEFEIGRQTLSKLGIVEVEDLFDSLKSLFSYCLDKFSLREGLSKQRTRKKESYIWQEIRENASFEGSRTLTIANKISFINENRLMSTATNALIKLFDWWGYSDVTEGLRYYHDIVDDWLLDRKGMSFQEALDKKRSS